eukprot:1849656-Rhodomonas_salina.1
MIRTDIAYRATYWVCNVRYMHTFLYSRLRVQHAMSGTDIAESATHLRRCPVLAYIITLRNLYATSVTDVGCATTRNSELLEWDRRLQVYGAEHRYKSVLCSYARATRCPVLRKRASRTQPHVAKGMM